MRATKLFTFLTILASTHFAHAQILPPYVQKTLEQYNHKLKSSPEDPQLLVALGRLSLEWNQFAHAKIALERAREVAPGSFAWKAPLAKLYLLNGQAKSAAEITHGDARLELLYTEALLQLGQISDAQTLLKKNIRLNPHNATARAQLIESYLVSNQIEAAHQTLLEAQEQKIQLNTALGLAQAKLAKKLGDTAQAKSVLFELTQKDIRLLNPRLELAQIAMEEGNIQELKNHLTALKEFIPHNPQVLTLSAGYAWLTGDASTAEYLVSLLIKSQNISPELQLLKARYFLGKQQWKEANTEVQEYLKVYPQDNRAKRLLALIALQAGQGKTALYALENADKSFANEILRISADLQTANIDRVVESLSKIDTNTIDTQLKNAGLVIDTELAPAELARTLSNATFGQSAWLALVAQKLLQTHPAYAVEFLEAIKNNPKIQSYAQYMLAQKYYRDGDFFSAEKLYDAAYRATQSERALEQKVGMLIAQDKREEAKITLEKETKKRQNPILNLQLAYLFETTNELDKALEIREQEAKTGSFAGQMALLRHGVTFGKVPLATVLEKLPNLNHPMIWEAKATLQKNNGFITPAIATLEHALEYQEVQPRVYEKLAHWYAETKDYATAQKQVQIALHNCPTCTNLMMLSGELYERVGDTNAALKMFDTVIAQNAGSAEAILMKAKVLSSQGKKEEALAGYKRAFELAQNEKTFIPMINTMVKLKFTKEAQSEFNKYLQAKPNAHEVRKRYAQFLEAQGEYFNASNEYHALMVRTPSDVENIISLSRISARTNPNMALEYAQKAYALEPNNPAVEQALGWAYVITQQEKQGQPLLENALAKLQTSPSVHYYLAVAHKRLGENTKAKELLNKAIALGDFSERDKAVALLKWLETA